MRNMPEAYPEIKPQLSNKTIKVLIGVALAMMLLFIIFNLLFWNTSIFDGTGLSGLEIFR